MQGVNQAVEDLRLGQYITAAIAAIEEDSNNTRLKGMVGVAEYYHPATTPAMARRMVTQENEEG